jgi:drug/metabolite transporter (DMT)-like permease
VVIYIEGKLGTAPWFGILLMLLAVFSTQGYSVLLKTLAEQYNALSIICWQNLIGIVYFIPIFIFTEASGFNLNRYSLSDFIPVLNLSVFASTFAFLFFIEGIKTLGIAKTVVFTNLIPLVTVIFAFILLSEPLPILKAGGIGITILGLFMAQSKGYLLQRIRSNRNGK